MKKATVIYHSADYDGLFCREIARQALGKEGVEYIGWNHGDEPVPFPAEGTVYILDLPPGCVTAPPWKDASCRALDASRIVWIDHHKTSIEKWGNADIPGFRMVGVAACRLAYQFFNAMRMHKEDIQPAVPPSLQDFRDRNVIEPLAVRLAGEYDVWDHRGDGDLEMQFALDEWGEQTNWKALLEVPGHLIVQELIELGRRLKKYQEQQFAKLIQEKSFLFEWEGLVFTALNHPKANSLAFASVPEGACDAFLSFHYTGARWSVSLYHAPGAEGIDLSKVAVKYGGGGHRGACGFTCDALPWLGASRGATELEGSLSEEIARLEKANRSLRSKLEKHFQEWLAII